MDIDHHYQIHVDHHTIITSIIVTITTPGPLASSSERLTGDGKVIMNGSWSFHQRTITIRRYPLAHHHHALSKLTIITLAEWRAGCCHPISIGADQSHSDRDLQGGLLWMGTGGALWSPTRSGGNIGNPGMGGLASPNPDLRTRDPTAGAEGMEPQTSAGGIKDQSPGSRLDTPLPSITSHGAAGAPNEPRSDLS
jgi:hypothetical protein